MTLLEISTYIIQIGAFIALYLLIRPIINGAVYFPTHPKSLETIVELASVSPGEKVADLGSGDGRISIALAKHGAESMGYEINPILVHISRSLARKNGVENSSKFFWKSFWKVDLAQFDVVVVYGMPHLMSHLERKFKRELRPGTRIISNIYPLPNWRPERVMKSVYLYIQRKHA